jgi:hypothetical protein
MGNLWFGSVTAAVEAAKKGQEFVGGGVKTDSSKSPKKATEEMMKDCPSGSCCLAICNVPDEDNDIKIVFVSCKHNARKVLHLDVMTAGAGPTVPDPNQSHLAKFPDEFGNVAVRKVPRPARLSD